MPRPGRRTNLGLLLLVVIALITGVLAFAVGDVPAVRVIVAVHGAAGLGVLLLVPWKFVIVRRGLRRPGRARTLAGLGLVVLVFVAVGSGLLHALGGFELRWGVLPMQLHVGVALVAVPLLGWHLWVHRRRREFLPRRTDVSRRAALQAGALTAGSAALYFLAPGLPRRETGSHEVGSGRPAVMPVTQWLFDAIPALDEAGWRLGVPGGGLTLADLAAMPWRTERAILDCTGGWYAEQDWRGVPLEALLGGSLGGSGSSGGRSVEVVSVTGYRRLFPLDDVAGLLLATHAGGQPLSAGHGGPARLVAPGRRGFWWVKWVSRIELVDKPWWWQPPFPTQ
ncbi:MAG: oxidoreductase molybdopterin binding protein [Pseudonocardia sp.]|nr:oxidoreductase molybdopterin binding protein [Pseudonocardia sp.]